MYNYSDRTKLALSIAARIAAADCGVVGSEHLLCGICRINDCLAAEILQDYDVTARRVADYVNCDKAYSTVCYSANLKHILSEADRMAKEAKETLLTPEYLLLAVLEREECIAVGIITKLGVDYKRLYLDLKENIKVTQELANSINEKEVSEVKQALRSIFGGKENNATAEKCEAYFGEELVEKALNGKLDEVIGRNEEIDRVIQILLRRTKNNPILIGEAGVGKTALVEGLCNKIASGCVPTLLKNKKVFSLNVGSLLAGTKYRGDFEEKLTGLIDRLIAQKDTILFIDEIHMIIGAGSVENSVDCANILKPYLARGELQTIGATTTEEYRKYIEKDSALERRFQPVVLEPPSVEETVGILRGIKSKYERHHGIAITDGAIECAARLSDRYITERFLPDKAIDLLDEALSKKRLECDENDVLKEKCVTEDDVAQLLAAQTKIPFATLKTQEGLRLFEMERKLNERIIGQEKAVRAVVNAIKRAGAGVREPKRPIGSFVFLGQSGTGKTELAKAIAQLLFGGENDMLRFDMSEYTEAQSFSKLIGSAPGYVGYEDAGQLTEKVRRKPYCVVLFDEIDKAHKDFYGVLLQVLEEGKLTDCHGRQVNFSNTVIIMTCNTKKSTSVSKIGFDNGGEEENETRIIADFKHSLSTEFVSRLDEIVVFKELQDAELRKITRLMLQKLSERLKEQRLNVEIDVSVDSFLMERESKNGARLLRRAIIKYVENPLSDKILSGELNKNGKVKIYEDNNRLIFTQN